MFWKVTRCLPVARSVWKMFPSTEHLPRLYTMSECTSQILRHGAIAFLWFSRWIRAHPPMLACILSPISTQRQFLYRHQFSYLTIFRHLPWLAYSGLSAQMDCKSVVSCSESFLPWIGNSSVLRHPKLIRDGSQIDVMLTFTLV